jgi:protein phosphatase
MGSRAVVVVGREPDAVPRRFAIAAPDGGRILTRTGRPFAPSLLPTGETVEAALLTRLRAGLDRAGLWDELRTDWPVLDCRPGSAGGTS